MLYVNDQAKAVQFWTEKAGFVVISEEDNGHMRWYEIAPTAEAGTTLVLHDKAVVAEMSPGVHLGTPSLMFYTDNVDELYKTYADKGVTLGQLVEMPQGKVFNFADDEGNYFAVMEKK